MPATLWSALKVYVTEGKLDYQLELDDNLLQVPASKDGDGFYQGYKPVLQSLLHYASKISVASMGLQQQLAEQGFSAMLEPNVLSRNLWRTRATSNWQATRSILYMGSPSHDDDFTLIAPALAQLAGCYPDFKLVVIGVFAKAQVLPHWVLSLPVPANALHYPDFVKWFLHVNHGCCAAIAPLQDSEFNAGKSPLKILDYAAIGLPVLASNHSVYQQAASQAPAVTLVENTDTAWFNALAKILANPAALQSQSQAMQQWVFNEHCR